MMGMQMLRIPLLALSILLIAATPVHAGSGITLAQWPGWQGAPGYGQEWEGRREHCWRMRERLQEIRYRWQNAPPWERERIGTRYWEIRERLRHECWGHWHDED